jgi:DNA helicase-2/ATP-dependent DNA helicase PcrA
MSESSNIPQSVSFKSSKENGASSEILNKNSSISLSRHLENLNEPQKQAVLHKDGPILVLAGAGTGKTRVLTRRIANLIVSHNARPSSIMAVTFTNKAAHEMKERLKLLVGSVADLVWTSTFHSSGVRILRRHADKIGLKNDFTIYDSADTKELIKKILKDKKIDEKKFSVNSFTSFIDKQKHIPLYPDSPEISEHSKSSDYQSKIYSQQCEVYTTYQQELQKANAVDFGDLLGLTHRLLKTDKNVLNYYQNSLEYLLVDEFQDTNQVQYDIIKMLSGNKKNLLVVGDDDQSIYAFRGATIQNILTFEKDFPDTKVIKLEQNYRSTKNILEAAHSVIEKNQNRKDKKVWTASSEGDLIELVIGRNDNEEAAKIAQEIKARIVRGISLQDIAVFYRTNAQSRAIEEAFLSYNIPYKIFGGLKFYDRKEIKDLIAYLRLISNSNDDQAFLRIINTPTRGIGAQTVVQISENAKNAGLSLFEAAKQSSKANKSVNAFVNLIDSLKTKSTEIPLYELIKLIVEKTKYTAKLQEQKDDPQAESRLENINELISVAASIEGEMVSEEDEFKVTPLQLFLDKVALVGGDDENSTKDNPNSKDFVSLMTLHLAKGLEFDVVFLTGMEDGLIPHQRTFYEPDEIDEERRLCYVGMTRARKNLFITRSAKRGIRSGGVANSFTSTENNSWFREPSRFIFDIPKNVLSENSADFFSLVTDEFESFTPEKSDDFDPFEDFYSSSNRRKPKKSTQEVEESKIATQMNSVNHLPPLSIELIKEGIEVTHGVFGSGTIKGIEGDIKEPNQNFKVVVFFPKINDQKKLLFKYAGLRVG